MKVLRIINRILAVAIIVWAIAVPIYLTFFARVSYATTTSSATQGEPVITETVTGTQPWMSIAEPISVFVMLAFSGLLIGGGIAVWKGAMAELIILTMLALVGSYITGFSIGVFYLPGAIALAVATILSAITKRLKNKTPEK